MKKIIILPVLILALIIIIWLIVPAYSNGTDGLKEKYLALKAQEEKLNDLLSKKENAKKLSGQLVTNSADKDVIYEFVPSDRKDEEIIDSVNFFAFNSGLSVARISTKSSADTIIRNEEPLIYDGTTEAAPVLPTPQSLPAEIKLTGSYEKIREFFANMAKFEKYNECAVVKVSKETPEGQEDSAATSNFLTAEMTLEFNTMQKAVFSQEFLTDPVFSAQQLDFSVAQEIRDVRSGVLPALNVEQKGRSNPFAL